MVCLTTLNCNDIASVAQDNPDREDAVAPSSLLWPGGDVYIAVDTDFFDFNIAWTLREAADFLETNTAIRVHFIDDPSESPSGHYVRFSGTDGWFDEGHAPIGISLGGLAESTSIKAHHMLGHIVGLAHTQSRVDRDDYVTIHPTWIADGEEDNFAIFSDTLLVGPYDIESVMHSASLDWGDENLCSTISTGQNDADACIRPSDSRSIVKDDSSYSYWNTAVMAALYCDARICDDKCAPRERCARHDHYLSDLREWEASRAGRAQAQRWPQNSL